VTFPTPFIDYHISARSGNGESVFSVSRFRQAMARRALLCEVPRHSCNIVVSRFFVTSDPNVADPTSEQNRAHPAGGQALRRAAVFRPRRRLYVDSATAACMTVTLGIRQDPTSLLGRCCDSTSKTGHPDVRHSATNPFVNTTTFPGYRQEIWALGFRNPWRFFFRPSDGISTSRTLARHREEVDFNRVQHRRRELGWKIMRVSAILGPGGYTGSHRPVWVYTHTRATARSWGASVYRGRPFRACKASMSTGLCTGRIWGFGEHRGIVQSGSSTERAPHRRDVGEDTRTTSCRRLHAGGYTNWSTRRQRRSWRPLLWSRRTADEGNWGRPVRPSYAIPAGKLPIIPASHRCDITGAVHLERGVHRRRGARFRRSRAPSRRVDVVLGVELYQSHEFLRTSFRTRSRCTQWMESSGPHRDDRRLDAETTVLKHAEPVGFAGGMYLSGSHTRKRHFQVTNTNPARRRGGCCSSTWPGRRPRTFRRP